MIRGGRDVVFGQSLVRRSSIGRNWIPRGTDVVPCAGLVFHPLHSWKRSPALINTSDKSIGTLTSNACCRGAAALVCTVTATVLSLLVMRVTVFLSTAWAAKLIARCFSWWRPEHQPLPVGCLKAVNFLGLLNASAEFSRHREVRFGSKADIRVVHHYVRFTPKSGHRLSPSPSSSHRCACDRRAVMVRSRRETYWRRFLSHGRVFPATISKRVRSVPGRPRQ
jgi:hypothetical protein